MTAPYPNRRQALSLALLGVTTGTGLIACSGASDSSVPRQAESSGAARHTGPAPSPAGPTATPTATPTPSASHAEPGPPDFAVIRRQLAGRQAQAWGMDLPGIATSNPSRHVVLSFDACGGPGGEGYDAALISLLRRHQVKATLFINSRWARRHHALTAELVADPLFEIGNHGTSHLPLSVQGQSAYGIPGTGNLREAYDEVVGNQHYFGEQGWALPRTFRPGTAHYDDLTVELVLACGLLPLNFSLNSDAGATFPAGTVATELDRVGPGETVIGHFNQPGGGTAAGYAAALPAMLARGLTFAHASDAFGLHG